ncbi:MAG: SDR family NAD(P)-dependent oxidoreductase, partial [Deltaproteobacteria bacterium]|nr:SDR family NAD(P)-dependent oxidoreductase [Deltaproteobacteria bacterium]
MLTIRDSVALITGGSGGIGMALARYWISKGGKVVLADVAQDALARAERELKGDILTMVCDVTKEDDCAGLADAAIEKFGQINLVAPFAGIIMDGLMVSTDRETG